MFTKQAHELWPTLGTLDLWCNRCGENVAHSLIVETDNEVTRMMGGNYRDTNAITRIQAECNDGHRQTIL